MQTSEENSICPDVSECTNTSKDDEPLHFVQSRRTDSPSLRHQAALTCGAEGAAWSSGFIAGNSNTSCTNAHKAGKP